MLFLNICLAIICTVFIYVLIYMMYIQYNSQWVLLLSINSILLTLILIVHYFNNISDIILNTIITTESSVITLYWLYRIYIYLKDDLYI